MSKLLKYLTDKMFMQEVYQPLIILELLKNKGKRSKTDLATVMARYDYSVLVYYKKVLMEAPRKTLEKHGIAKYRREGELFELNPRVVNIKNAKKEIAACKKLIAKWLDENDKKYKAGQVKESARYETLKRAKGKCELCGVPAEARPLHVDHIVPQSRQNKAGKVRNKAGKWIDVNSLENLQALCFKCNCNKRATDNTDFRRTEKLVRDRIPDYIRAEGREPEVIFIRNKKHFLAALDDKLVEELGEYIAAKSAEESLDELADMLEVIFALAKRRGAREVELILRMLVKRKHKGGYDDGCYYTGDIKPPSRAPRGKKK